MRHDFAMLSIIVVVAIVLQLVMLKPTTINKTENQALDYRNGYFGTSRFV